MALNFVFVADGDGLAARWSGGIETGDEAVSVFRMG